MRKQVLREVRKAKTSVKFKEGRNEQGRYFVAWYECEHDIVKKIATYFQRNYRDISWTLLTPTGGARWDKKALTYLDAPIQKEVKSNELENSNNDLRNSNIVPLSKELSTAHLNTTNVEKVNYNSKGRFDLSLLKESYQNIWKSYGNRKENASLPFVRETQPKNIKSSINHCTRCELNCSKGSPFIGEGHQQPDILFVAEKPEKNKHAAIRQLIHKVFQNNKSEENHFHLTYAVKNTVGDSTKLPSIIKSCRPWLENEISTLRPKTVVCFGKNAAFAVLGHEVTQTDFSGCAIISNHRFEIIVVEDCFRYMSHPKFKEKFQIFSAQMQDQLFKSCAA